MDDESVRTLDTLCITHPVQPSTTTLLSTHRIAHHTTTQSAAIRESIVSPVATGGRHKHPQRPQSHARRTLRCGFAQACAAARRARALGRSDDMMIDDHVWTRVIERMALCRTNCSIPQSREVRVDSPVSARRKADGDASLIQRLRRRRSVVGRRSRPTRQAARDQRRRDERTDGYRRTRSGARL